MLENITGATVTFGRKAAPAQYESVSAEVQVSLREGADIEGTLVHLEEMVEKRLIGQNQRRVERERFYAMLFRCNVPAEDSELACEVMGIDVPDTTTEFRVATERFKELYKAGPVALPITWVWFKDGVHPHPKAEA